MNIETTHRFVVTYFKPSGKYYTEGDFEGRFEFMSDACDYCRRIMDDYTKEAPGLSSNGGDFIWLVTSESHPNAYPCLLIPRHIHEAIDAATKKI